jgi:hypothetical protein
LPDLLQGLEEAVHNATKAAERCIPAQEDLFVSIRKLV